MSKVKMIQEYCEKLEKNINRMEMKPDGFHKVRLISSVRSVYEGKFFQHDLSLCVDMIPIYTERIVNGVDSPEIRFHNQEELAGLMLFNIFGMGVMASKKALDKIKLKEKVRMELFELEQQLGIRNKDRFHNSALFNDPVKGCSLYKDSGCSHVDGMLCDYPKCDMLRRYSIIKNFAANL